MPDDLEVEVVLEARASVGEGPVSGRDRRVDVGQPVGAAALREGGGLVLARHDIGAAHSGMCMTVSAFLLDSGEREKRGRHYR